MRTPKAFLIEVEAEFAKRTLRRLQRLSSTLHAHSNGKYRECSDYVQLYIETELDELQLDNWLSRTKGVSVIGIAEASFDNVIF